MHKNNIYIKLIKPLFLFILLYLPICRHAQAQNDILLTQQWLSRININPAATGNSNNIDVFVLMRQQWQGFDNAPSTQVVNLHSYFDRIRSGIGLTAVHDEMGMDSRSINAKLSYAFHVNIGSNWLLSLGLSGGILQNSYDPTKHFIVDEQDPEMPREKVSELNPDFDFGFEFSSPRFIIGASVTHLARLPDQQTSMKQGQQYYAYLSYKQPIGESFDLVAAARGSNFVQDYFLDVSLTVILFKKIWIGGAFRPDNAVAGMAGFQLGFIRLGYAYDYSIGETSSLAKNSHEIMVSLKIGKGKKTVNTKSPRFIENF